MGKGFLDGYKTYDTSKGYGSPKQWQEAFEERMNPEDAEMVLINQTQSPHEILGVKANATAGEIKKAFRKLIMEWHPDRNENRIDEAKEMSQKIIAAYSLLTDK
ncbi:J domain-containing protein [Pedobacter sp. B4-66]|uniref:J domain-containing protein n=1 Tax=Pedobacter sp. B4-66 TaxID=2817280 RepID=UPI001BDA8DCC|nr:J domain-containing protein [Pedobacter sp. B4-66]